MQQKVGTIYQLPLRHEIGICLKIAARSADNKPVTMADGDDCLDWVMVFG
jgi:hypothetical protein